MCWENRLEFRNGFTSCCCVERMEEVYGHQKGSTSKKYKVNRQTATFNVLSVYVFNKF